MQVSQGESNTATHGQQQTPSHRAPSTQGSGDVLLTISITVTANGINRYTEHINTEYLFLFTESGFPPPPPRFLNPCVWHQQGFKHPRQSLQLTSQSLAWSPLSAAQVQPTNLPASGHLPESLKLVVSAGGLSLQPTHLSPVVGHRHSDHHH